MKINYFFSLILTLFLTTNANATEVPTPFGITLGHTKFATFVEENKLDNQCKLKSHWTCSTIFGNVFGIEPKIWIELLPWPEDIYGLKDSEYEFLFQDKTNQIRSVNVSFFMEVMEYVKQTKDQRTDVSQLIKVKGHPTQKYYKYLVSKYGKGCHFIPNRFGGFYRWNIKGVRVELKPAEISYYLLEDKANIDSYFLEKHYKNLRDTKEKEKRLLNNL